MKVAIITAACGDRDDLHDPEVVFDNAYYIACVDREHSCEVWDQRPIPDFTFDDKFRSRRNYKICKVLPHLLFPGYEAYIWVDATHELVVDPVELCRWHLNSGISLYRHEYLNSPIKELYLHKRAGIDHADNDDRQMEFYKEQGVPDRVDYFDTAGMILGNTPDINRLCLMWWEQICRFSSRDQPSLAYCIWKSGVKFDVIPGFVKRGNPKSDTIVQKRGHK